MLTTPNIIESASNPNSPSAQLPFFGRGEGDGGATAADVKQFDQMRTATKSQSAISRGSRKSKMTLDIGCLPEGVSVDLTSLPSSRGKPPPSPLNLSSRQVINTLIKWCKRKNMFSFYQ